MGIFHKSINKILYPFHIRLARTENTPAYSYDQYEDFEKLYDKIRSNTMVPKQGCYSLFNQVIHCERNNIEGDYIECGVWKGGCAGLMALTNLIFAQRRRNIHLFDSFEGICEPDETVDGWLAIRESREATGKEKFTGDKKALEGFYDRWGGVGTLEINRSFLQDDIGYDKEYIHFHKGWIQDTMPEAAHHIDKIAILRIDVDWYEATKVCLDELYDRVVPGGFVIFDDYGRYEGSKKAVDEFLNKEQNAQFLHHATQQIRYIVKR